VAIVSLLAERISIESPMKGSEMRIHSGLDRPVLSFATFHAELCILFVCVGLQIQCFAQAIPNCNSIGQPIVTATDAQPQSSPKRLVVILDTNAPPETITYLASIAKKETCETDVAQTLADVAKLIGPPDSAVEVLENLNPTLPQTSSQQPDQVSIPAHTDLLVPEISAPTPEYTFQRVPFNTTGLGITDHWSRLTGPNARYQFFTMNVQLNSLAIVPAYSAIKIPRERSVRLVNLAEGEDAKTIANKAATKSGVRFASPDYEGVLEHPVQINPDILASTGAHYDVKTLKDDWFVSRISADKLIPQDLRITDPVFVAVLDSGLDLTHPAFQNDLWTNPSPGSYSRVTIQDDLHGYDFRYWVGDPKDTLQDSHGTHVGGIASARFLGTLPSASVLAATGLDGKIKLMIIRVADNNDHVSLGAIVYALDYASYNQAHIVSASWTMGNYPYLDLPFRGSLKTLFVVAAGNGTEAIPNIGVNVDEPNNRVYPPSYRLENVITVGASDPDGNVAYFSNWGPNTVDLLAPGVNIKSTVIHAGSDYALGYNSGSSQAAPFVTLTAALILAGNNLLPVDAVKKRILFTADATNVDLKRVRYGRLNLLKAVAINEDLIETRDHKFYRGTIMNQLLHFGAVGSDCTDADKLLVNGEKIFRVVVDFDHSTSRLFRGTHVSTGRLCDETVTIKTDTGSINLSTANIHDIVWHGVPQFELPN
jgi:hypothetical protein